VQFSVFACVGFCFTGTFKFFNLTIQRGRIMKTRIYAIAVMSVLSVAICKPVFSAAASSEYPLTVNIKRLSLDTALRIGQAAIEKCRKEGVQVTVTVVDRGGHPQVVLRDTLAMDVSTPISLKKAYTAMEFNAATSELENRFPGAYGVPKLDELLMSAGGIPINIGGNIMGGIGVSGAPSGLTDESCAQAGLAAVIDDLEMH
jgi:uncharacterized protein GlcG (DUF336 family)